MEGNFTGNTVGKYYIEKQIGQGNWSEVYSCFHIQTGIQYAVKVTSEMKFKKTPKLQELIKAEITILRECNNQNVIKIFDSFSHQNHTFMVMEFCNGGDLGNLLQSQTCIPESIAVVYLKQMLHGFRGLHQVNAMHRDFKIENVLMHNKVCKIADLGFGRQLIGSQMATSKLGSNFTMAPEVMQLEPYNLKADIWSIGIVFYQLLFGDYPFRGRGELAILQKALMNNIDFTKHDVSQVAQDFIRRCLTVEVKDRIGWKQIYKHPLITDSKDPYFAPLSSKINIAENSKFYHQMAMQEDVQSKYISQLINKEIMYKNSIYFEKQSKIQSKDNKKERFDSTVTKSQKQMKNRQKQQFEREQLFKLPQYNHCFYKKYCIDYPSPSNPKQIPQQNKKAKQQRPSLKYLEKDKIDNWVLDNAKSAKTNNNTKGTQKCESILRKKNLQQQQYVYRIQSNYLQKMDNIMYIITDVLLKNNRIFKIVKSMSKIRHQYYVSLIYIDAELKLEDLINKFATDEQFEKDLKYWKKDLRQKRLLFQKQMKQKQLQIQNQRQSNYFLLQPLQKAKINHEFKVLLPDKRSSYLKDQLLNYWYELGVNFNQIEKKQEAQLVRFMQGIFKFAVYNQKNTFNCYFLRKGLQKYDTQMGKKAILSTIEQQRKKRKSKEMERQHRSLPKSASCQRKTHDIAKKDKKIQPKQTNIFQRSSPIHEYNNERAQNYPNSTSFQISSSARYQYLKNRQFQSKLYKVRRAGQGDSNRFKYRLGLQ